MKFSLFRLPKMRQFEYKPLYFDPEKERREKRRRTLLGKEFEEENTIDGGHASRIKGAMRTKHTNFANQVRKENKTSNLRLIIIVAILTFIAYYLYQSSGAWFEVISNK